MTARYAHRQYEPDLVTKHDLTELRKETKADLADFRKETKADLADFRREIKADFAELRRETKEAMQQIESRHQANFVELKVTLEKAITKAESSKHWAIGLIFTVAIAAVGFILTSGI